MWLLVQVYKKLYRTIVQLGNIKNKKIPPWQISGKGIIGLLKVFRLFLAVSADDLKIVKELIARGVTPNIMAGGTPLLAIAEEIGKSKSSALPLATRFAVTDYLKSLKKNTGTKPLRRLPIHKHRHRPYRWGHTP